MDLSPSLGIPHIQLCTDGSGHRLSQEVSSLAPTLVWVDELGRGIVIELAGFLRGGAQDVTTAKICQTPYFCTGCLAEPPHYYGQGLVPLIHSSVFGRECWSAWPLRI